MTDGPPSNDGGWQFGLPLAAPPAGVDDVPVPARMVNEWVYCPRLAYLEWVDGEWADNADTAQGRRAHARVDAPKGALPPPADTGEDAPPFRAQAVEISSERLGLVAKLDLVEDDDGHVSPVDYKKGRRPHVAGGAYEPERVQLCVQALILEDNGYRVRSGFLWFAASRERVPVVFDADLRARTLSAVSELRLALGTRRIPPPLENSPKCHRCSLLTICLPDEVTFVRTGALPRSPPPAQSGARPLYVQQPGARVGKDADTLTISPPPPRHGQDGRDDDAGPGVPSVRRVPIGDVSELILAGPVGLSTPALHALIRAEVPVAWMTSGFWFLGATGIRGPRSAAGRLGQYRVRESTSERLAIARGLIEAKVRNQRTILRRNWRGDEAAREGVLGRLRHLVARIPHAPDSAGLMGLEGEAAALYFRSWSSMLNERSASLPAFAFERRSRRPPADPVNACLSLCYALLTRLVASALEIAGLDPWCGILHADRPGRPSLALDLMEPFRPIFSDSTVLTVLNTAEIGPGDFVSVGPGCNLTTHGRRTLIQAFERRLDQEVTHPAFGYEITMRQLVQVQARLLARLLKGEISHLPHYMPR